MIVSVSQSTQAHTVQAIVMVSLSSCLKKPQPCFSVPWGMPFIMWHDGVDGGGEGGCQTAVSHQHSVNCSQPVVTLHRGSEGQSSRVELKETRGPKYPQLKGHPNLFFHIHSPNHVSQACSVSVMYKSVARGERVAAIWEWLCLFLIVSCIFASTHPLSSANPVLARLPWLVQVLSPHPQPLFPCTLRLGMLNSSHSCTACKRLH